MRVDTSQIQIVTIPSPAPLQPPPPPEPQTKATQSGSSPQPTPTKQTHPTHQPQPATRPLSRPGPQLPDTPTQTATPQPIPATPPGPPAVATGPPSLHHGNIDVGSGPAAVPLTPTPPTPPGTPPTPPLSPAGTNGPPSRLRPGIVDVSDEPGMNGSSVERISPTAVVTSQSPPEPLLSMQPRQVSGSSPPFTSAYNSIGPRTYHFYGISFEGGSEEEGPPRFGLATAVITVGTFSGEVRRYSNGITTAEFGFHTLDARDIPEGATIYASLEVQISDPTSSHSTWKTLRTGRLSSDQATDRTDFTTGGNVAVGYPVIHLKGTQYVSAVKGTFSLWTDQNTPLFTLDSGFTFIVQDTLEFPLLK